jgi:hypothetical protein
VKSEPQISLTPLSGTSPEQACDARARAWAYVFECFRSHIGKEGSPETAPDDAKKESKHVGAKTKIP